MRKKGFTLIELLVVVAIIGVLASIVLSSLSEARQRARNTAYLAEIIQLQKALELYHIDYGSYPPGPRFTRISQLAPLLVPEYINNLPEDIPPGMRTSTSYITEYTGDQGCVPEGVTFANRAIDNRNYTFRVPLSSATGGLDYSLIPTSISPSGVLHQHCVRGPQ